MATIILSEILFHASFVNFWEFVLLIVLCWLILLLAAKFSVLNNQLDNGDWYGVLEDRTFLSYVWMIRKTLWLARCYSRFDIPISSKMNSSGHKSDISVSAYVSLASFSLYEEFLFCFEFLKWYLQSYWVQSRLVTYVIVFRSLTKPCAFWLQNKSQDWNHKFNLICLMKIFMINDESMT